MFQETIEELREDPSSSSTFLQFDANRKPKYSILKVRLDPLYNPNRTQIETPQRQYFKNIVPTDLTDTGVKIKKTEEIKPKKLNDLSKDHIKISILKRSELDLQEEDHDFCLIPKKEGFGKASNSVEDLRHSSQTLVKNLEQDPNSKAVQKDTIGLEKGVQSDLEISNQHSDSYFYDPRRESNELFFNEDADMSDIYHNFEKGRASTVKFGVVTADLPPD